MDSRNFRQRINIDADKYGIIKTQLLMIKSNMYHMVAGKYQMWNFQWNPEGSDTVFSGCVEQLAWRVLEILRTVYFFINVRSDVSSNKQVHILSSNFMALIFMLQLT